MLFRTSDSFYMDSGAFEGLYLGEVIHSAFRILWFQKGRLYYTILYKGLERPQILVSKGDPGVNAPWRLRDNRRTSSYPKDIPTQPTSLHPDAPTQAAPASSGRPQALLPPPCPYFC